MLKKPDHGARSSVLLATADIEELNSSWYWPEGLPARPLSMAQDPRVSEKLWQLSEDLIRKARA